ncbi:MAG: M4 family metallopeptidase [Eubacterium sp.]
MKCKNCNNKINSNEKICPNCVTEMKPKKALNKKAKAFIAFACCVVLIISGTIGGLYFYRQNNIKDEYSSNYISFGADFTNVKVTDEKSALEAISSVAEIIGIENVEKELETSSTDVVDNDTYYRFQQYYNDIPVYGKSLCLVADKDGKVVSLTTNYNNISKFDYENLNEYDNTVIYIKNEKAYLCTKQYKSIGFETYLTFNDIKTGKEIVSLCQTLTLNGDSYIIKQNGEYKIHDQNRNLVLLNSNQKVLEMDETITSNGNRKRIFYTDDNLSNTRDTDIGTFYRNNVREEITYNINNDISFVTSSNIDNIDQNAINTMESVEKTYQYYADFLERKGFDNHNSKMYITYNDKYYNDSEYENNYGKNAYSNESVLKFGYALNTASIDIIAHEFTHSVERTISNMTYAGESGAIMEGYSDTFGEIIQAYYKDNKTPDWEIDFAGGKRNIANPEKQNLPQSIDDDYFKPTDDSYDNGNVHGNSTVISHSAHLMWNGIDGDESKRIDCDTLANLWYRTLFIMQSDATFQQFANNMTLTATHMVRNGELTANQLQCVLEAFDEVGIKNYENYSVINSGAELYVNDIYLNAYDNYHVTITEIPKIRDYLDNNDLGEIVIDTDVINSNGFKLDLGSGNYLISLKDNYENGSKNEFVKIIKVIDSTYRDKSYLATKSITMFTDFGKSIKSLIEFIDLTIDEWETIMYSIYKTDYSVTESSGWIPDSYGNDRILYYNNNRIPLSFLTNVGDSNSTIPNSTDTISDVCFSRSNKENTFFSVDGNINTEISYLDLKKLKDGILWQDSAMYAFTYKVGEISIDFEYYDKPTDDSIADCIYVSKRDWDPEAEEFDDEHKKSAKKYLSDMPITKESHYEGNMGDSYIFLLKNPNDPSVDTSTFSNGNIALDGTICENGFEAWLARWNYEDEISWASATFQLDSNYSKLTGKTNITDGPRTDGNNWNNFDTTIYFYDGDRLLASYNLTPKDYKKEINVDVSNVKEITVLVKDNKAVSVGTSFALYDLILK